MNRPDNMLVHEEMDLKLGIKSSLPRVKSTIALAILLWECSDHTDIITYSKQNGNEIVLTDELEKNVSAYLRNICEEENIQHSELIETINENQLFKSQMEALIVAFELIWKIAKVSFEDTTKAASAERTGGIRYPKRLSYSANIDILHSVISNDETGYLKVLMSWIGFETTFETLYENNLISVLTALSEDAIYKITDGNEDVVFNQDSIYRKLIETESSVDINGDKEAKGSLRILKSYLSEGMNPFLEYKGGQVSRVSESRERLETYQKRVNTLLALHATKIVGDDVQKQKNLLDEDENQAAFEEWMRKQVIPEGDSNAGSHYSDVTIQTYVSDIKFHKVMIDGQERTLFATNDLGLIEGLLDNNDVESARKTAIRKYKQFVLSEEPEEVKPISYRTGFRSAYPLNRIVFGAPGTGKSFTINRECKILLGDDNDTDYERVTFHPDYSYANFVGTYKPVPSVDGDGNETITYEYVPGPFMRVYVEALRNSREDETRPFLLIIEEINRANVAAVFGDIFQLLDRDADNVSEYPIQASEDIKSYLIRELGGKADDYKKIRIPDNMFIWATMNSADQGVFPMDTAFKRRWDFTYLGINDSDQDIQGKYVEVGSVYKQRIEWNSLRMAINDFLASEKINEDKQLGPYFISRNIVVPTDGSDEIDSKRFCEVFKHKVLMYLFDDAAKQKRAKLFEGCQKDKSRYSEICKAFDEQGIGIFNSMIQTQTKVQDIVTNNHELDENGLVRTEA